MQRSMWLGILTGGILALGGWLSGRMPVAAQERQAPPAAEKPKGCCEEFAFVDLKKVLDAHQKFMREQKSLKVSIDVGEKELNAVREKIAEKEHHLSEQSDQPDDDQGETNPNFFSALWSMFLDEKPDGDISDRGGSERSRLDAEILQEKSDFNAAAAIQKKQFMDQETAHYATAYDDIKRCTKQYAELHGIRAVVWASSQPYDPKDRQDVSRAMSDSFIYRDDKLDITDEIIKLVNGEAKADGSEKEKKE